jgi:hypothetical protein
MKIITSGCLRCRGARSAPEGTAVLTDTMVVGIRLLTEQRKKSARTEKPTLYPRCFNDFGGSLNPTAAEDAA